MVNEEFSKFKPKYSESELENAIGYAFDQIQLPMEEIGKDVYEKLFRQHFYEVISKNKTWDTIRSDGILKESIEPNH